MNGLRALCLALGLAIVVLVSSAWRQSPIEVVRAKGIVIVDDDGRERILIGAPVPASQHRRSTIQGTGVVILDETGVDRLALGETKSQYVNGEVVARERAYSLLIHDRKGDERGGMGTFDSGKAVVVLDRARPGSDGVAMLVDEQSDFVGFAANHRQRDGRYVQALALGVQRDAIFLNLDDPTGRRRLSMSLPASGDPKCRILGIDGDETRDVFVAR